MTSFYYVVIESYVIVMVTLFVTTMVSYPEIVR